MKCAILTLRTCSKIRIFPSNKPTAGPRGIEHQVPCFRNQFPSQPLVENTFFFKIYETENSIWSAQIPGGIIALTPWFHSAVLFLALNSECRE